MSLGILALALLAQQGSGSDPRTPYWQQRANYDITASLDEAKGVLSGTERIIYVNHSPDTLRTFALHLYLNAFRPGSRWADVDSVEQRRRFNDLKDPDYAFNHVTDVRIMGQQVSAIYPFAPDSTIVRFVLPRPLPPGDSMEVSTNWDARPSTLPRRQGRRGRAFDFAQWYPRVVAYDRYGWEEHPLYPAGEFYGEFGTFKVLLDVPSDQVVGSTGVPLCGDPGWAGANRNPSTRPLYQRDFYPNAPRYPNPDDCGVSAQDLERLGIRPLPDRKQIMWYAEDVHHFAMSMRPDYRYEGGRYNDIAIHVLYQPGDEASWGGGLVVARTDTALAWLQHVFGKYPWPQLTNVHRIEGGGTEFPMMVMDGGPQLGLIIHEFGHNYLMGILANNEWKEGFLDEGFTEYQTNWYYRDKADEGGDNYAFNEEYMLGLDLDGYSEPTSLVGEAYRDFTTYNLMIYARGNLFYHQLRYIVGDSVMQEILHTYYDRWKLKHVTEEDFREVAEEVSHQDLKTFFGQWLHNVTLYDYAVGKTRTQQMADGRWQTRVEVKREGDGMIPVEVAAIKGSDTTVVRSTGMPEREWVQVITPYKPGEVMLDPRAQTHDWNMLNNRRSRSWLFGFVPASRRETRLDRLFSTTTRRDRIVSELFPTVWFNDVAGFTLGLRSRENYLGRFEQNNNMVFRSTGWSADGDDPDDWGFRIRMKNPVRLYAPRASQVLDIIHAEGRSGVLVSMEQASRNHLGFGPTTTRGASLRWLATDDMTYLNPALYDNAGTVEGQVFTRSSGQKGRWQLAGSISLGGGVEYLNESQGIVRDKRFDAQLYFRGTLEATARRRLGTKHLLGLRFFAGYASGEDDVVKQRRIYLSTADPYEKINNPFTRSRGALLVREDVNYHTPGGGNLRGFSPALSAKQVYALNAELERIMVNRPRGRLFNRVTVAAFGDVALSDADLLGAGIGGDLNFFGDAGVGIRAVHMIGTSRITTRVDFPIFVSRPLLAQDDGPGLDEKAGFRWMFSFAPTY